MCNPMAIGLVLGIGGGVLQGIGGVQGHENNAVSYEMAAAGNERDIAAERESSAYDVATTRRTIAKTQGGLRGAFAANGLALSGSAADVLHSSAAEGDLDIAAIRWNSENKIGALKYARDVNLYNAGQERAGEPLAFISPVISGAAHFGGDFG